MKILELASYVLQEFSRASGGLTHLKLQKLLYYVKAWGLVAGMPLTSAPFLKLPFGPINPVIRDEFHHWGTEPIELPETSFPQPSPAEKKLIDFIVENYLDFPVAALSAMIYGEAPWQDTPDNTEITDERMFAYYSRENFAKNFPLTDTGPFYPVISDMDHSFFLDMSEADMVTGTMFPSYQTYKEVKEKTRQEVIISQKWLEEIVGIG